MTDANAQDLCVEILPIYRQWLMECHEAGLAVRATVTWRSRADQDKVKALGLSNASAKESPHNCMDSFGLPASKAFDFAIYNNDASYVKDGMDPRYRQAGEIGESLGLVWGGRWLHPDWDHLELANWKTLDGQPATVA